ncbi:hypothetical protein RBH29_07130 [Herbivorax sp. ANBcel31]|uniref:hypothetical protein n=1 Tax=Herbivorax sp. ANBcel31 TaxID=3069754 RepID=UPI0027B77233|nr:hypothetical protein [Herbivorax sp. ANBcel31]MDQ2086201.1 hypothetical protein [Herbivorax sp. ANBcel31]
MNQNNTELKPMRIGDVADYSIEIFKRNFKVLFFLSLILYVPWIIIDSLVDSYVITNTFGLFEDLFSSFENYNHFDYYGDFGNYQSTAISNLFTLLNICYSLSIKVVFQAAVMKIVYDYMTKGRTISFSYKNTFKLIRYCFKYMWRMAGYTAIFYIILFALYFVSLFVGAIIFVFLLGIAFTTAQEWIMTVFIVLFALVVILGMIILVGFFWVRLIFGNNIIVNENSSFSNGIKRAFQLSKGSFWHIGISSLFCYIIYSLIGGMVTGISVVAIGINNILFYTLYSFGQVLNAVLYPFVVVFITVLFIDAKVKKEAFDLELKLNKMIEKQKSELKKEIGEEKDD